MAEVLSFPGLKAALQQNDVHFCTRLAFTLLVSISILLMITCVKGPSYSKIKYFVVGYSIPR